tara:strand:- start:5919 stop:6359 length:441 start_codon:yes stop_codon:yes gene_type:complete
MLLITLVERAMLRSSDIKRKRDLVELDVAQIDGLKDDDIRACVRACRIHVYEWDGTPKVGAEVAWRIEHQTSVVDCQTEAHRGAVSSRRTTTRTNGVGLVNIDIPVGVTAYWTVPDAGIFDAPLAITAGNTPLNIIESLKTASQVT